LRIFFTKLGLNFLPLLVEILELLLIDCFVPLETGNLFVVAELLLLE
jgi:hypothetical protein